MKTVQRRTAKRKQRSTKPAHEINADVCAETPLRARFGSDVGRLTLRGDIGALDVLDVDVLARLARRAA